MHSHLRIISLLGLAAVSLIMAIALALAGGSNGVAQAQVSPLPTATNTPTPDPDAPTPTFTPVPPTPTDTPVPPTPTFTPVPPTPTFTPVPPTPTPTNVPPQVSVDQPSVPVDEGQTATNTGTVSDVDGDTITLTASVGSVTNNGNGTWSWSFPTSDGPDQSQTVTITADDGKGGTAQTAFGLTVNNVAPVVGRIAAPTDPVNINFPLIQITAVFTDPPDILDTYTAVWDWGDGATSSGTVGASTIGSDSHSYAQPGVYTLELTVADDDGGKGVSVFEFVVVYDPDGGFVTGGGWINSPEGACRFKACTDDTTGKASFGFVSKYKKGANTPTGNTEFQFKAGDLNFHSSDYEWLVIAGANAKYKGTGTINGAGEYKFMLTATDGDLLGDGKADEFRIKIWDDNGWVYDNKSDLGDADYGGTELGGGSIVIHRAKGKK
jgi:hypothetical protein